LAADEPQRQTIRQVNVNKKGQSIEARLLHVGCLLVTLFLALQLTPQVPAQLRLGNQSMIGSALQRPVVSIDTESAAGASPIANCNVGFLYDQYNNPATEPPVGVGSQKFEPTMAAFEDQAADDFVLTSGFGAIYITGVRVMGEYSAGGGPASSFNIYFYQNGPGNEPGAQIHTFENLPYTGTPTDFVICLPSPFSIGPGTYWVSVQAHQDFNPNDGKQR
jgi:hypothetical protein